MKTRSLLAIGRDERGATAAIVAVLGAVLIGTAGVALDTGLYFSQQSNLQTATEAAALSAAADHNLGDATSASLEDRARQYLGYNGYTAAQIGTMTIKAEAGFYCPDNDGTTRSFQSANNNCSGGQNDTKTALKLDITAPSTSYLTRALGGGALLPRLASTATAARVDEAGLGMTTGVLGIKGGLVKDLLSLLAGRTVALSLAQRNALLASNVDAGLMFDALAALPGVNETRTYGKLMDHTVTLADLASAIRTTQVSGSDPLLLSALDYLAGNFGKTISIKLRDLFKLGVWEHTPIDREGGGTSRKTGLRAGLNSYQLLTYALESEGREVSLAGLTVPAAPIATVKLGGMVTSMMSRPRFAFGPHGETTVGTAAVRILLEVKLLDLKSLLGGLVGLLNQLLGSFLGNLVGRLLLGDPDASAVYLPLLLQVSEGTATVDKISCGPDAKTQTDVQVIAHSGLLGVFLGEMPSDVLSSTRMPITSADVKPAELLNLGVLAIRLRATVQDVAGAEETVTFTQNGSTNRIGHPSVPPYGIVAGIPAKVGNRVRLGSTLKTIAIEPEVRLFGGPSEPVLGPIVTYVAQALAVPIGALVDPLVNGLLDLLGLQLGNASVSVTGVRCGVPVLV